MNLLPNIILGIIGVIIGTLLIRFAFYLNHNIVFLGFIERKYGSGSGTTAYMLAGFVVIVISFFVILGQFDLASALTGSSPLPGSSNSNNTTNLRPQSPSRGNGGTDNLPQIAP